MNFKFNEAKAKAVVDKWTQKEKNKEDVHRYGFEEDMKEVHKSFVEPSQNSQSYLKEIADNDVKYRDLFIALYDWHTGEDSTIERWRNE